MPARRPAQPLRWSLGRDDLAAYVARQLSFFALPRRPFTARDLRPFLGETCRRVEHCIRAIRRKYYFEDGRFVFSHLHGDHYAKFLYFLGNTIHRSGRRADLAQASFQLNKMLHGLDAFYSVSLPEVFLLIHPVGTVLGAATYRDYLVIYQNCTVGSTADGVYPRFGTGAVLFARSALIGDCTLGDNVVLGANAFVLGTDIPAGHTVVGAFPHHRLLPSATVVAREYFGRPD